MKKRQNPNDRPPPLTPEEKAKLDRAWEAYQANPDDVYQADRVLREAWARLKK